MRKLNKTQLTLLLTGFILIILTYFYYPNLDKNLVLKNQIDQGNLKVSLKDSQNTVFENIK